MQQNPPLHAPATLLPPPCHLGIWLVKHCGGAGSGENEKLTDHLCEDRCATKVTFELLWMVVGSTSERLGVVIRWLGGKKWDVICEERGSGFGGEFKPGCDSVGEK